MKTDARTAVDIADHFDHAAALIEAHGKERGSYWPGPLGERYQPGMPVDAVGALAVTFGIVVKLDVDQHFAGVPFIHQRTREYVGQDPHPALAALMAALGVNDVEAVWCWSDDTPNHRVVERLRSVADQLRGGRST